MSRVESPRLYSARILSSNPWKRRWRLRTIFGWKLPSLSRGASNGTLPCSVISVFGLVPLRLVAAPPGDLLLGARAGQELIDHLIRDPLATGPLHHPTQSGALHGAVHPLPAQGPRFPPFQRGRRRVRSGAARPRLPDEET